MHRIIQEGRDAEAVAAMLGRRLRGYNERRAGPRNGSRVVLRIQDDADHLIGGLSGSIFWNALYIESLWVDAAHRKRGYGAAMLAEAERIGLERQCEQSYLTSFTFQAPEFYVSQGYEAIGELADVPNGSSLVWLRKQLGR